MIRRRRRPREIAFSFDSFLDVVANVVGIIIRLILVVWVGARSYGSLRQAADPPAPPAAIAGDDGPEDGDPLTGELAEERKQLAEAEAALRREVGELDKVREGVRLSDRELAALTEKRQARAGDRARLERDAAGAKQAARATTLTAAEVRARCQKLAEEIKAVRAQPAAKQLMRYRTPVSKPLEAEELFFECRKGRVTFVDIGALRDAMEQAKHDKAQELRGAWEASDVVGPVGPFQLRYTLERVRDALGGAAPDPHATFSFGVLSWRVEPITEVRGESQEEALKPGSEFRQIADGLDKHHAAVTFWVYPDSFALYRHLRDYLYDRDIVVAGRPLPDGMPIAASARNGSASRGQ